MVWSACWLCYSRNIILWAFLYFNGSDWTNGIPTFAEAITHLSIKTVFKNITSCKKCKYNPSKKLLKSAVFFSQLLHIICQRINGVPNISKSQSYLQMIDFTVKFISILPIDGAAHQSWSWPRQCPSSRPMLWHLWILFFLTLTYFSDNLWLVQDMY